MTAKEIAVTLPESLLEIIGPDEDILGRELCLFAALKLYEVGRISLEKAAELAGKSPTEFRSSLQFYRVPSFSFPGGDSERYPSTTPRQRDFIDELKANPIAVENWVKLNRANTRRVTFVNSSETL